MRTSFCLVAGANLLSVALAVPVSSSSFSNHFGIAGQNATYDYVVVGGGTGGLAIAYRLAEDGKNSVAVVEAGGFYEIESGNISVVPAYNQQYNEITPDSQWLNPLVDWGFLTTPQAGAQNQTFHYGRGKMLGGCSAENAMNYNLPTIGALKAWADAVNDTSYTWDEFLPYYRKSISYTGPNTSVRAANASVPQIDFLNETTGPLQVSFPNWATPLASWAQLAFRELGIQDTTDQINGTLLGSQYNTLTLNPKDQSRQSSQTSFLDAAFASNRTNLKIYTHTLAKKILFDSNKTAQGVSVQSGDSPIPFTLSANKEVIISAGAFQSPQLLMVSGIGPSATLTSHNIPVLADLPGVGQNMWDHVVLSIGHQVDVETYGSLMNMTLNSLAVSSYLTSQSGILTNDQSDYLAWEKISSSSAANLSSTARSSLSSSFPSDWPQIEYEISSAPFGTSPFSTPENPIDVGYIQPVLLTPFSRGSVTITSSDMSDPPVINPNWLTNPIDQEIAMAAFRRGRRLFSTSAISPILVGEELLPGTDTLPITASDAEILKYLQANIGFNWHASCTCKMGDDEDEMAVLDSKARVRGGVGNLRVVDASSFPFLPPGHPQASVYALAEKIAGDILGGM